MISNFLTERFWLYLMVSFWECTENNHRKAIYVIQFIRNILICKWFSLDEKYPCQKNKPIGTSIWFGGTYAFSIDLWLCVCAARSTSSDIAGNVGSFICFPLISLLNKHLKNTVRNFGHNGMYKTSKRDGWIKSKTFSICRTCTEILQYSQRRSYHSYRGKVKQYL